MPKSPIDKDTRDGILRDLATGELGYVRIGRKWGVSKQAVARLNAKYRPRENPECLESAAPELHVKPDFSRPPLAALDPVAFLKQAVERVRQHPTSPDEATVTIKTDKPVAVMMSADWHFGGLDVDYSALQHHVEFLLNTPSFYLQLIGDDLNMMVMHRMVSARHDGWTPTEQIRWLEAFVQKAVSGGKLISMAWGHHSDEFTERNAGFGIVRLIAEKHVPYFRGLGYVRLRVGSGRNYQEYPIAFTHQVRFHSFMNAVHGNKRMQQLHAEFFGPDKPIARVYAAAHHHYPALAMEGCIPADRIYYVKCGTFKTNCAYSQRYFGQGRIGVPTIVYHPDRFEHVAFPTPWEAYRYMTGKDYLPSSNCSKK